MLTFDLLDSNGAIALAALLQSFQDCGVDYSISNAKHDHKVTVTIQGSI